MLNSSRGLIGSRVFPFPFPFFCIDWQPGGTGKQNISHQTSAPVEKRPFFQSSYIWVMCLEVRREKNPPPPEFQKWLGQLLHSLRLPTCGNTAPEMSCFASISMQTAGPPFPEVKITANVCTQSHFEPRQTPLIWRLLAPALTSCFMGARKKNGKGGKESVSPGSRDFVTGGCCTSEPALFSRTTPIYLPESSRPIGWGRAPFSRRRTT